MKKTLIILGIITALIIAAAVMIFTSLDQIVAAAIERFGSMATQTEVTVSDVTIKPASGEGTIKHLNIGNPPGFSTNNAFTLEDISIKLDTASVTKETVIIEQLTVTKPHVTYEINSSGQANINLIKQNITELQSAPAPKTAEKESSKPGTKMLIRRLEIKGGQVDIHVPVYSEPDSVKMPDIELTEIGNGGAPPREIAARLLTVLIENTGTAVAQAGVQKYLGKNLEEMKGQVQKQIDEKAREKVEEFRQESGDAVRKLLGK